MAPRTNQAAGGNVRLVNVDERDRLLMELPALVRHWCLYDAVANWAVADVKKVVDLCGGSPELSLHVLKQYERTLIVQAYGPNHPAAKSYIVR